MQSQPQQLVHLLPAGVGTSKAPRVSGRRAEGTFTFRKREFGANRWEAWGGMMGGQNFPATMHRRRNLPIKRLSSCVRHEASD